MAVEIPATSAVLRAFAENELRHWREALGYRVHPELGFEVKYPTLGDLFDGPRLYNRPFTKREARRHRWQLRWRRLRWKVVGPIQETRQRLDHAWYALKGGECQ